MERKYTPQQFRKYNGHSVFKALESLGNEATADELSEHIGNEIGQPEEVIKPEVQQVLRRGISNGFLMRNANQYSVYSSLEKIMGTDAPKRRRISKRASPKRATPNRVTRKRATPNRAASKRASPNRPTPRRAKSNRAIKSRAGKSRAGKSRGILSRMHQETDEMLEDGPSGRSSSLAIQADGENELDDEFDEESDEESDGVEEIDGDGGNESLSGETTDEEKEENAAMQSFASFLKSRIAKL